MNGRYFTRVNYSVAASIMYDDDVIMCNTDNLSLHGMYLKTYHDLPLNVPVHVTVHHSSQSSFKVNAHVVRKEANGVGLKITSLNAKSFAQLRDIVAEKCDDYMKVLTETLSMVKRIC
jgi:PilZ domain-containing protein